MKILAQQRMKSMLTQVTAKSDKEVIKELDTLHNDVAAIVTSLVQLQRDSDRCSDVNLKKLIVDDVKRIEDILDKLLIAIEDGLMKFD